MAQTYRVCRVAQDGTTGALFRHGVFIVDRQGTVRWANVGDAPFRRNPALLYQLAKLEDRMASAGLRTFGQRSAGLSDHETSAIFPGGATP